MSYPVKQVILMRTDLRNTKGEKVRTGKLMSQAGHAATMWLSKRLRRMFNAFDDGYDAECENHPRTFFNEAEILWLEGSFAKIVLAVDNEALLLRYVDQARAVGIVAEIVVDNGTTEFGGVPTTTCAAIGPDVSEKIDQITGSLKPL